MWVNVWLPPSAYRAIISGMDIVSREKRSRMMAGIRGKNTGPEALIRKLLHARGFRFRLHDRTLPGKPDIILKRHRVVVFVDGCFWHGHRGCHLFKVPESNTDFWKDKIEGNIQRDKKAESGILDEGGADSIELTGRG